MVDVHPLIPRAQAILAAAGFALMSTGCPKRTDATPPPPKPRASETVATGPHVDDFQLLDHHGRAHRLYDQGDAKLIVMMTQGNGCPIVRNAVPTLKQIRDTYEDRGVRFFLLNSNLQDDRASITEEVDEFDFDMPVLVDEHQLVAESLEVTRTAEVFVIDANAEQVVYHGPIDDRLSYEKQKSEADTHYLIDALDAALAGQPVEAPEVDSPGCLINLTSADSEQHASISYAKTIAPLLERRCVECHQEGGIGPWAMDSYAMVQGFAPMIREVVRTGRMPPWHADPAVGEFRNDKSLTPEETKTLVHWIEAGAPRGEGPDPLAAREAEIEDWPLGEPDLILTLPAFEVPATGVVEYQYPVIENPLTESKWLRASTVKAGSRETVHHLLSGMLDHRPEDAEAAQSKWGASVAAYAVGAESRVSPDDLGTFIPAGGYIAFQMHYTSIGKAVTDQTQIGLYFHDETPRYVRHSKAIMDTSIAIPAGARRHHEVATMTFPRDALLYSAFPHAHFRGYASSLAIRDPEGNETVVLSLPRYDFNWQRFYDFAEPLRIPAGSQLVARYVYDNSPHNPANPDPTRNVRWGNYTADEMLYTILSYRWVDETSEHRKPEYDRQMMRGQAFDMLDDDLDGVLREDELRGGPGGFIRRNLPKWDDDGDGELTRAEFSAKR